MASSLFRENVVYDIEARDGAGIVHKASFYVENGLVHLAVEGCTLSVAIGNQPPDITARGLLNGYLMRKSIRHEGKPPWAPTA